MWTCLWSCASPTMGTWLLVHPYIPFVFNSFPYNVTYSSWLVTSYYCTSFTLSKRTYHWWFRYPLALVPMWGWTHRIPQYSPKYRHNDYFRKWNTHTKRGFPPLIHHTQWRTNISIINNVVIVDSTHLNMVYCPLPMITHAMIIVMQEKTQSYVKCTLKDDFIPLAIETYGCFHSHFDLFKFLVFRPL
jgi:hypothetical protein